MADLTQIILNELREMKSDIREFRREITQKADTHERRDTERFDRVFGKIDDVESNLHAIQNSRSFEAGKKSFWEKTPTLIFGSSGITGAAICVLNHFMK